MEKAMMEKKNDLIDKMNNIVNTAKAENRAVTEEEANEFDACEKEIKQIENTITMEKKMEQLENKVIVAPISDKVEAERKTFENMIRSFKNTDTPMTYGENGAVIPRTIADRIISQVYAICPVFNRSEKYNVKGNLTIPAEDKDNTNLSMAYADEFTEAESGKITIKSINLGEFLGRALCKVSKSLINNSQFDIVAYVIDRMALAISRFVENELLNGTEDKIEGLSGVTQTYETAEVGVISGDDLIDLQESVLDEFQNPAIWIMSRNTRKAIRKLKDEVGNYLLNRDFDAQWGYELLGKPVYTTDNLDDNTIYYGDFSGLATKISEDMSMQVLYEKYATQHAVGILAFMGIDAKVQNPQKISKLSKKQA